MYTWQKRKKNLFVDNPIIEFDIYSLSYVSEIDEKLRYMKGMERPLRSYKSDLISFIIVIRDI